MEPESQNALRDVLRMRGVSERATHAIWNKLRPDETLGRSEFQEEVEMELRPWKDMLVTREFALADGGSVSLPIVNLKKALTKALEVTDFATCLAEALKATPILTPVIYCDECAAGNVLGVEKNRKASLWRLSWKEFGHNLGRSQAWIPLTAIQYDCVSLLDSGSSQILVKVLEEFLTDEYLQGTTFETMKGILRFRQRQCCFFLGDNEAIRAVTLTKGSSGLKPCLHCSNLLKKASNLRTAGDGLVELDAHTGFLKFTNQEIFDTMDNLANCASKAQRQHLEKISGLCWSGSGLWNSAVRNRCPPDHMLTDLMHSYNVNGVASWEVAMFLEKVMEHTEMTLSVLKEAIVNAGWKSFSASGKTTGYVQSLFHPRLFGEGLFKGQCHQTRSIVPLLRFYCETLILPAGRVPEKICKSFLALSDVLQCIGNITHSIDNASARASELDRLQQGHHKLYGEAYGVSAFKPKHHHRHHLVDDLKRLGFILSTETLEGKHQLYKGGVGQFQKTLVKRHSQFAFSITSRLLHLSHASLQSSGLPLLRLMPPVKSASLDDQAEFGATFLKESECILAF